MSNTATTDTTATAVAGGAGFTRRTFAKGAGAGIAAIAAAAAIPGVALAEGAEAPAEAAGAVKDGMYTASAQGKHAEVEVKVTVADGKIASVEIGENDEMPGMVESIEKYMLPCIVDMQTLNVDYVTGATITSAAVVEAVGDALGQAGFDVEALASGEYAIPAYEAPAVTDADVIVLGAGGAGLSAALTATAAGKSVIVLEKLPSIGGNTQISGGGMAAPCNWIQEKEGIEDSPELFESDVIAGGDDTDQDHDLVNVLANNALDSALWLRDEHNVAWQDRLVFFGGHSVKRSVVPPHESGAGITWPLKGDAEAAGVVFYTCMQATEFVMNEDGSVAAVKAQNPAGEEFEFTGKAFVLATGGFGSNVEMRVMYNPDLDEGVHSTDTVGTTGDGVKMAEAIGVDLVGMKWIQTYPTCDPVTGALLYIYDMRLYDRGILVNAEGSRFVEELDRRDVISNAIKAQTGASAFLLWDEEGVEETGLFESHPGEVLMGYNLGTLFKGDTLEEVAEAAGVDPAGLVATVERWNQMCDEGADADFNYRSKMNKFETGPYYLGECVPSVHHTMGGVHIDTDARTVKATGETVPNLFAAGEVTGGIHGTNRLGSDAVCDCITFGRVAGASAADEA